MLCATSKPASPTLPQTGRDIASRSVKQKGGCPPSPFPFPLSPLGPRRGRSAVDDTPMHACERQLKLRQGNACMCSINTSSTDATEAACSISCSRGTREEQREAGGAHQSSGGEWLPWQPRREAGFGAFGFGTHDVAAAERTEDARPIDRGIPRPIPPRAVLACIADAWGPNGRQFLITNGAAVARRHPNPIRRRLISPLSSLIVAQ
jgi:hypothetical protein